MTPRERILATINHQVPDRIPTDGWFHPEVVARLKKHYHTDDWPVVLGKLGVEGWGDLTPHAQFPDYENRVRPRPGHPDSHSLAWIDEHTYEDAWGIRFRMGNNDRYQRWLSGPLEKVESVDDLASYQFPSLASVVDPDDYVNRVAQLKRDEEFVSGGIENPFKRIWHLRGYENALMDYLANREVLDAIYDPLFALGTEIAVRATRAGVDMIKVVGDVAMQDRIIMGPKPWREVDKPRWGKLIDACRAVNKGVHFFFHSDGKLTDLMDDLIDVGFDVINPIQPECMDPIEIKKQWGNRITLHGCISIQQTLPFGTVADVRKEVETLIRQCGRNGGLVLMPSNVIQPDTPLENIIACYETARDFKL
jgi:uroporphyrinogen decarboxylase